MNETAPYTVKEVAALTAFSERTVTKMFENEKGVLIYEVPRLRKRASYLRIATFSPPSARNAKNNAASRAAAIKPGLANR